MADKPKSLSEFLAANPITGLTAEVYISQRFKEAGFPFKITAMTGHQFNDYQKQATAVGRHRKMSFDSTLFNELVILNHCVVPNFKDANEIQAAGCTTPEQYLYSRLLAGEINELSNQISILSGFDSDMESMVDDVKNF